MIPINKPGVDPLFPNARRLPNGSWDMAATGFEMPEFPINAPNRYPILLDWSEMEQRMGDSIKGYCRMCGMPLTEEHPVGGWICQRDFPIYGKLVDWSFPDDQTNQ